MFVLIRPTAISSRNQIRNQSSGPPHPGRLQRLLPRAAVVVITAMAMEAAAGLHGAPKNNGRTGSVDISWRVEVNNFATHDCPSVNLVNII